MTIACSGDAQRTPLSPSATGGDGAAAADGSTLKALAPVPVSPRDGIRVDTRRPSLTFANAAGTFQATAALTYRLELLEGDQVVGTFTVGQAAGGQTTQALAEDLKYATTYRWRVRAELEGAFTAYSPLAEFVSPNAPASPTPGGGPATGNVGANRSIPPNEVLSIIIGVHNGERWDLGSASTREQRVAFWFRAVGIVHYGHPVFNPQGGDPDWCVKDAGGGRPPSDDVFARCGSREAWDTISSAGANGYGFHLEYLGRLPGGQNVFAPPVPSGGGGISLPVDPNRPSLPDVRGLVQQFSNQSPAPFATQSCPRGLKYVNNPWQDYIVDRLRQIDPRWGYNGKPSRTAADNGGVPVVAAGDELAYYYGSGTAQGSSEVYLVDILEGHCGSTPRLTWRVFTGEEPGRWSGAGRF